MRFLIYVVVLTLPLAVSAQHQEWVRRYNGPGDDYDYGASIVLDRAGYLYVAGQSTDSANAADYLLVKYSRSGEEEWLEEYNGEENLADHVYGLAVDDSSNIYMTGSTQVQAIPLIRHDYMTVKYDSSGSIRWMRTFNGGDGWNDAASDIAVDDSGNVFVTGWSRSLSTDDDYLTIAYSKTGDTLWVKRYFGPDASTSGNDYATGIAVDNGGNVYVTGYIRPDLGSDDWATIKYLGSGDIDWVSKYDGPPGYSDMAEFVAVDGDGNILVAGETQTSGSNWDYLTIKYDAFGDSLWIRRYNGPGDGHDLVGGLVIDDSGNVYITGKSYGSGGHSDMATVKYRSDGEELWVSRYSAAEDSDEGGADLALDDSGNVFVAGWSEWDCITVKYDSEGDEKWVARYDGPDGRSDAAMSVVVDDSGYVYVTGGSVSDSTGYDCVTIKYGPSTGIEASSEIPVPEHRLFQILPNPANGRTMISYSCVSPSYVLLKVYDPVGRLVRMLHHGEKAPGWHEFILNAGDLPQGLYFVQFSDGTRVETRKLVVLR